MAMNFPGWVTDSTPIPAQYLVPAKKALYIWAACEKSRRLICAMGHWYRNASGNLLPGDSPTLSQEERDLLTAYAPYTGTGYDFGHSPTDAPTLAEVKAWQLNTWEPRDFEIQATKAAARERVENFDLSWVDWDGLS